jgi:hypothetical protein
MKYAEQLVNGTASELTLETGVTSTQQSKKTVKGIRVTNCSAYFIVSNSLLYIHKLSTYE